MRFPTFGLLLLVGLEFRVSGLGSGCLGLGGLGFRVPGVGFTA